MLRTVIGLCVTLKAIAEAAPNGQVVHNIAKNQVVYMSTLLPGVNPQHLTDGRTSAAFQDPLAVCITKQQTSPFVDIVFDNEYKVEYVELFSPHNSCEDLLADEIPNVYCVKPYQVNDIDSARPMRVSLYTARGASPNIEATTEFYSEQKLYRWEPQQVTSASGIRISLPGMSRQLGLAEVKVFGTDGKVCDVQSCGHGECDKLPGENDCVCEGDWVGRDCSTNMIGHNFYLPRRPSESYGWWDQESYSSFLATLNKTRDANHCYRGKAIVKEFPGPGRKGKSFEEDLMYLTSDFTTAYQAGLPFGARNWKSAETEYCLRLGKFGKLDCYFQPMVYCAFETSENSTEEIGGVSNAALGNATLVNSLALPESTENVTEYQSSYSGDYEEEEVTYSTQGESSINELDDSALGSNSKPSDAQPFDTDQTTESDAAWDSTTSTETSGENRRKLLAAKKRANECEIGLKCYTMKNYFQVPVEFKSKGIFWWRSVQLSALMRHSEPTAKEVQQYLDVAAQKLGSEPFIAVHIPQRALCYDAVDSQLISSKQCSSVKQYLPLLEEVSQRYNITNVFLSTTDAKLIQQTRLYPQFKFFYFPPASTRTPDKFVFYQLAELEMMSRAQALVLTLSHHLSRISLSLNAVRQQTIPPFVSMDGPYCPHWRQCCNVDTETGLSRACCDDCSPPAI